MTIEPYWLCLRCHTLHNVLWTNIGQCPVCKRWDDKHPLSDPLTRLGTLEERCTLNN